MTRHALVLGGARSGKSRYALAAVEAAGPRRLLIATAEVGDAEMADRIARHRGERGQGWTTREVPLALAGSLARVDDFDAVLVDCLTLWLSNVMLAGLDADTECDRLLAVVAASRVPMTFVSNEVGLGLVPETPLGRRFRDAQGRLNQRIAAAVADVVFLAAGLPLVLKRTP